MCQIIRPTILEHNKYIKCAIAKHLGYKRNNKIISNGEVRRIQYELQFILGGLIGNHQNELPENEHFFLRQALQNHPDKLACF